MKFHIAKMSIKHSHESVRESKVLPFTTELNLEDIDLDIPIEESIETLKNGGCELAKQFLSIIAEDCKGQRELRHEENEIRRMQAENETARLKKVNH